MSSFWAALARGSPKATTFVVGGTAGARGTQASSLRALSVRRLPSGLSQRSRSNVTRVRATGPQPLSALAQLAGHSPQYQAQRYLSSQSNESHEGGDGSAVQGAAHEGGESLETSISGDDAAASTTANMEGDVAVSEGGSADASDASKSNEASAAPAHEPVFTVQVDGIPFDLRQGDIEQWFTDAGVSPVRVTLLTRPEQSARAGQSKGRAYVELANEEDTQKAVAASGGAMGERWVNISRLDVPIEECVTISIRGMKGIGESDLRELVEESAGVSPESITIIPQNPNRSGNGLAFMKFSSPSQAVKALDIDGMNVMERWLDVNLHLLNPRPKEARPGVDRSAPFGPDANKELVLVMKGLPFELSEDEIKGFLNQYDITDEELLKMEVPKHNRTRFNTGVAYLLMKDEEAVSKGLALKGTYIGVRWVDVTTLADQGKTQRMSHKVNLESTRTQVPAKLREKYPDLPCVVVSGLPFSKSKAEVCEYLEEQGVPGSAVEEIQMPLFLSTTNNTGSCWLVVNEEAAYNRLMSLNGAIMDDRWVTVADA